MTPRASLRIVMTADAVGGVWVYASELARALCEHGHRVMLVVMGPTPRPHQTQRLCGVRGLEWCATNLQLEWMDPDGADIGRARQALLRIVDQYQPDIVHLNSFREATFDWPAPVLVVAHSCVRTWWRACRGSLPDEPCWHAYNDHVAAGLRAADVWLAPTSAFANEITATYQPPQYGRVIRNGLTLATVRDVAKQPVILAAGRMWDEAKNLKSIAAIAPELPWPLNVAGPMQSPDGASDDTIADVRAHGDLSRDDLLKEMRRSEVFVSPSLYEPFGLTVLEAAACGCALVLSDVPSFHELWGDAALFFNPHDPDAIARTLRTVCWNEKLRQRLQSAARARARLFSVAAMERAYCELYYEMIASAVTAPARHTPVRELRA